MPPLPLSAFLDSTAPIAADGELPDVSTPQSPLKRHAEKKTEAECLLAPDYLGCHQISSIGEELLLDGGRLRVWSGAAVHNDQAAAFLQAEARARQKALGAGAGLESKADTLFSVADASGSRVLGGAFLRAAYGDQLLHVWLAPTAQSSRGADGLASAATLIQPEDSAGTDAERVVHRIGPYRLRVLGSEVLQAGAGGVDSLQQVETLSVRVAADRVRAEDALVHSGPAARALDLPLGQGDEAVVWMSSQGVCNVSFAPNGPGAPQAPSADAPASAATSADIGSSPSTLPPMGCSLPPLLPPIDDVGREEAGEGSTEALPTVELALHVSPVCEETAAKPPFLFGCPPSLWRAELSVMSLGGSSETHATIALQPEGSQGTGAVAPQTLPLGSGYELCILQCTGHYARAAPPSSDGGQSTGFNAPPAPVTPAPVKGKRASKSAAAAVTAAVTAAAVQSPASAAKAAGSAGSAGPPQAMVLSDYPLLLVHARVAVRRARLAMAGDALHDALAAAKPADEPETLPLSRGTASESRKQAARREAQELGDFMEAMLLG